MREELRGRYKLLRCSDIAAMDPAAEGEEVVRADLTERSTHARLLDGIDGIIHLGGLSVEDDWAPILRVNIDATYDFFVAAAKAGVRRIVFASSNHVVGFYRRDVRLTPEERPRPDTRYGLSKAFGELLGQYVSDQYGVGILSVRIGSCFEKPTNERFLSTWVSRRDLAQLFAIGLETPTLHHEIVWGVSGNNRGWWDNSRAHELGYRPLDNAESHAATFDHAATREADPLSRALQGGGFVGAEYRGDPARVLGERPRGPDTTQWRRRKQNDDSQETGHPGGRDGFRRRGHAGHGAKSKPAHLCRPEFRRDRPGAASSGRARRDVHRR
jgi:uronate dehydrogenase